MEKALTQAPTVEEFRRRISQYSAESIVRGLIDLAGQLPPFITSRLVHEALLADAGGTAIAAVQDVTRLANELMQVVDPELLARTGTDLTDILLGRILPQQMIGQREPLDNLHRTFAVLAPEGDEGPLSATSWQAILGLDLTNFIIGVMMLGETVEAHAVDLAKVLREISDPATVKLLISTVELLSADLAHLRVTATTEEKRLGADSVRGLGPLAFFPLVRLADGRIGAPSPTHLRAAISTSALYVRLARADADEKSRERTKAVGASYARYLHSYTSDALGSGWQVRDLDQGVSGDARRGDLALWPDDRSFVVLVEAKSTLQNLGGQLRGWEAPKSQVAFYQSAFDQLAASLTNLGSIIGCAEAPTGVPTFGLVVTLEPHLTTVIDGKTYPGIPLGIRKPSGEAAEPKMPARAISADDFELLVESLRGRHADAQCELMTRVVGDGGSPEASDVIRTSIGDELPPDSPIRRMQDAAFERIAASAPVELVRSLLGSGET